MKRPAYVLLAVCGVLAAIGVGTACSNYGEGEVCNTANGSDDCDTNSGLACYSAILLNNVTSDRCCPSDRTTATHPACTTPVASITDATAPSNTGPGVTQDAQVADSGNVPDASDASDAADAQDQ